MLNITKQHLALMVKNGKRSDCAKAVVREDGNQIWIDTASEYWQELPPAPTPAKAKPKLPTFGLGDLVALVVKVATLGMGKPVAKRVAKLAGAKDCGCSKRQAALNAMVPNILGGSQ